MKRMFLIMVGLVVVVSFLFGCVTVPSKAQTITHKIEISVAADSPQEVTVEEGGDGINRTMHMVNQEGTLSPLSFILGDTAYIKIFSALSVGDVTNVWGDFCYLKHVGIMNVALFINSPGGDAFTGLALSNHIMKAKADGFTIIAHASGVVASAAVPVFAVCSERVAAPGTIFMVHETSIWKWPGRETHSDIRSQGKLMDLLRETYLSLLATNSRLTAEEWAVKEIATSWFSAETAMEWGLVDRIE